MKHLLKSLFIIVLLFFIFSTGAQASSNHLDFRTKETNIHLEYDIESVTYTLDAFNVTSTYLFANQISKLGIDDNGMVWIKTFEKEVYCIHYKELPEELKNPYRKVVKKDTYNEETTLEINVYMYLFDDLLDFTVEKDPADLPPIDESTPKPTAEPTTTPTIKPTQVPTVSPLIVNTTPVPIIQSTIAPIIKTTPIPIVQSTIAPIIKTTPIPIVQSTIAPIIKTTPIPIVQPTSIPTKKTATGTVNKKISNKTIRIKKVNNIKYNKKDKTLTFTKTKKIIKDVREIGYTKKNTFVIRKGTSMYKIKNNKLKLLKKNVIAFIFDFDNENLITKYVIKKDGKLKKVTISF